MEQVATAATSTAPGGGAPLLVHVFPSFGWGGVPIRITGIINRLGGGYRHAIVALDGVTAARSRLDPARDVTFIDAPPTGGGLPGTLWHIHAALRRAAPDLLLTYNWGAIEWALANRLWRVAPHMHLESGFGPEEASGQLPRRVMFRRLALGRTDRFLFPSQTLVRIATEIWKLDPARILYVPNGVDCDVFASDPDPAVVPGFSDWAAGGVTVGTLAPLRAEKNLSRLLRTFAVASGEMPMRLLIVGDGVERPGLEALSHELGIADRVLFAGHVEQPERVLGLFDIFAITSDTEQMPNTVIQAMAAGRAVAGVDVGDIGVNLSPENRPLLVARDDEPGFARLLLDLAGDATKRAALGEANSRHVRQTYGLDRMVAAYRDAYDGLLARRAALARQG